MRTELGKVMPSAIDIEELVLGAVLLEKGALDEVLSILTPECFYKEENRLIYKAICSLFEKSLPIDISTVTVELNRTNNLENVGGAYYILQLTNRIASSAHVEYHARIVKQHFVRRELIKKSSNIVNRAYEDSTDVFELLSETERLLSEITGSLSSKQVDHIAGAINRIIEKQRKSTEESSGISSGLYELDVITGGWNKTDLIIEAARPGMGKTGLVVTEVLTAAKNGIPVALFSIEMSEDQIGSRMLAQEAGISISRILRNKLSENEKISIEKKAIEISGLPIFIDDSPFLSTLELKAKARRLKRKQNIGLIVIDYLQLMTDGGKSKNREQEVSNITRSLKALAKELNIPVIALSQLSRDVEKRNKKHPRPTLSDLRESGSIEQDADMVLFLYRPDYYDREACDESGNSLRGTAEIIVAKNRNGKTETAMVKFEEWTTRFYNITEPELAEVDEAMPF